MIFSHHLSLGTNGSNPIFEIALPLSLFYSSGQRITLRHIVIEDAHCTE